MRKKKRNSGQRQIEATYQDYHISINPLTPMNKGILKGLRTFSCENIMHWGGIGDQPDCRYKDSLLISRKQYVQTITTHIQRSVRGGGGGGWNHQTTRISNRSNNKSYDLDQRNVS